MANTSLNAAVGLCGRHMLHAQAGKPTFFTAR